MPDWQDELSATDHPVRFALVFGLVWGMVFGLASMLISGGSWTAFVPALVFGLVVAGPGFALMTRRRARNLKT